jgi:hypothetical protein
MLKFLGLLVLLTLAFGLGYYIGQRPLGDLRKTVADLSRNVLDTTAGIERNFRARQGLVDAKTQVIQAKSELFDRNYGNAARALGEVVGNLEQARNSGNHNGRANINGLIAKIREAQQDLHSGKMVTRTRLDEIQKEIDVLTAP